MPCYYCGREGHKHATEAGSCAECHKPTCGAPPSRNDGQFHGDECGCGCAQIVCIYHLDRHTKNQHGADPSGCFPAGTLEIALPVIGAAAAVLPAGAGMKIDETAPLGARLYQTLDPFLNYVAPGRLVLTAEIGPAGARRPAIAPGVTVEPMSLGALDEGVKDAPPAMMLRGLFGDRDLAFGRLVRVAALACVAAGTAWGLGAERVRAAAIGRGVLQQTLSPDKWVVLANLVHLATHRNRRVRELPKDHREVPSWVVGLFERTFRPLESKENAGRLLEEVHRVVDSVPSAKWVDWLLYGPRVDAEIADDEPSSNSARGAEQGGEAAEMS